MLKKSLVPALNVQKNQQNCGIDRQLRRRTPMGETTEALCLNPRTSTILFDVDADYDWIETFTFSE